MVVPGQSGISILRARGGSSAINQAYNDFDEVFSAHAEVVPRR